MFGENFRKTSESFWIDWWVTLKEKNWRDFRRF